MSSFSDYYLYEGKYWLAYNMALALVCLAYEYTYTNTNLCRDITQNTRLYFSVPIFAQVDIP